MPRISEKYRIKMTCEQSDTLLNVLRREIKTLLEEYSEMERNGEDCLLSASGLRMAVIRNQIIQWEYLVEKILLEKERVTNVHSGSNTGKKGN